MTTQELKEKINKGEDLMLLDVREEYETKQDGKIEGSVNIPMGQVFLEMKKGTLPKDKKIVTICRSGHRSGIIAKELAAAGYDAESLEGGMLAWR